MAVLKAPHWETVSQPMRTLLTFIGGQDFCGRFYLAGGTALALQVGHRPSVDLDFFSETDEVHDPTRREIVRSFSARDGRVIENADGNLLLQADDIRIGFFSYGYKLLAPTASIGNVALASLLDIGLMKLGALIGRGSRKDFYDLYVIAQQIPLLELLKAGQDKYPQTRDFGIMAIESLVAFENAGRDVQPKLLTDLSWDQVQGYFLGQARIIGRDWFE